jgi:hypothetical protein
MRILPSNIHPAGFRLVTVLLAGVFCFWTACSGIIPQAGWTCESGTCHPDSGRWLGFEVGMSKEAATAVACRLIQEGQIRRVRVGINTSRGKCEPWALQPQSYGGGYFQPYHWIIVPKTGLLQRHCFNILEMFGVGQLEMLELDFYKPQAHLSDLVARCPRLDF